MGNHSTGYTMHDSLVEPFVTVLVRFMVMGLLNIWVLATVLHYRRKDGSSSTKKED